MNDPRKIITMNTVAHNEQAPWYSIAVLSMSALAYEIILMRLFSIIQWHHFAYMIISLALLGYGASGTFLALTRNYLLSRYSFVYLINVFLFGLTSLLCFLLGQQVQFNAEEILWDFDQALRLMSIYILLTVPFFFVANAIGLSLIKFHKDMSRIYAADLLGAGTGGMVAVALLFSVFPGDSLKYISSLAMLATILASWELFRNQARVIVVFTSVLLVAIMILFMLPKSFTELALSPYKGLSQTLRVTGTKVVSQDSSALGLITVVESPVIPFRHAPGLSLNANDEPPSQLGIFIDGDAMTAITHYSGNIKKLAYLDQLTSALPYHLSTIDHALVLGAGGGAEVLQAKYHKVKQISAVELNKQIIELVKSDFNKFSGSIYTDDNVTVFAEEARGFFTDNNNLYGLIQLVLSDSFGASSAGLHALNENYLYTVEALQLYLHHLNRDGYLAISRWIKLPPRDTLKLFTTAIDALSNKGIEQPERHLILIRGLQTSTLIIKNTPITKSEIQSIKRFCNQRLFDMAYYPGMIFGEANRYNMLVEPVFFTAALSLLGNERNKFIQRYKFNIEPATDNQPYFYNYFKWRVFPEILSLKGEGGMSLLGMGYLILVATFLQAFMLSIFIIILPLIFFKRKNISTNINHLKIRAFAYFLALGLSFLFVEMAFIQKFILFLQHPIYAVSVVLAAFLIFAGLGSLWTKRLVNSGQYIKGVKLSVLMILFIGLCYVYLLAPAFAILMDLPVILKIIISIFLIAPLAFYMGMPFPLGMSRLAEISPEIIPWVWGVNGCASVLSAVLAALLAIQFGFTFVIVSALVLYALAAVTSVNWLRC